MKMSLSRSAWAAAGAAVLLLAPVHAGPERVRTHYRELCQLLAVWDPNRTATTVVPEPARPSAARWHGLVSGLTTANVTVNYDANFDPQAKAAFQAAVDIWASQISSTVPIVVDAHWVALGSNVLGQAGATFLYSNFGGGIPNTFYHSALANKIAGFDVDPAHPTENPTNADIDTTFNSAFPSWYFGTDSAAPFDRYDFMSVVLHELAHGLGFSGSATSNGSTGSYGLGTPNTPMIYERFAENASRQALLNTAIFGNPSVALHNALTSETADPATGLFWNGPNGVTAAGGGSNRPRLDALAPFTGGSNYSHLSEATYPIGNINSLMTRGLANGEVIHNPGPITLGMFQDEGWSISCSYLVSTTSILVLPTASTGTITVTAPAGCAWTASAPAGSFVTITGGASGTGNGTVSYSVAAAPSTTPRSTTLSIAGYSVVVAQGPVLAIDHASLRFGATNSGGALSNVTAAQTVALSITGASGIGWTATVTSASPWLRVTGGSGTGSGAFTVSVQSEGSLSGLSTATGTIRVAAPGTSNTPKTVTVVLGMTPPGTSLAPVGAFDTPVENSVNTGSVAVTGWALDDIEVVRVQIQRDAHPGDPPAAIFNGRVFIADASFVEGARPDVESAVTAPLNYRAGWGYLMLTRGLIWDGQGPFKLYAVATDKEGNTVTLGSKTITVANATSTTPFGNIDTPGQGATVSGSFFNFGWGLTPNPGGTACRIPANGVLVSIDSGPLQPVTYGGARGDIAAGFPGFTNSAAAGGSFLVDTTVLANGTHTIGWILMDDCGRADGVGSRFFKVQNSSQITTTASNALIYQDASMLPGIDSGAPVRVALGFDPRAKGKTIRPDAFGRRHVAIGQLDRVAVQLAVPLPPKGGSYGSGKNDGGSYGSGKKNGGSARAARYAAYQVANGTLRKLPSGSSFDPRSGTLYWQPGAGYVGNYDFVVVDQQRKDAKRLTHVTVSVGRLASPAGAPHIRATN